MLVLVTLGVGVSVNADVNVAARLVCATWPAYACPAKGAQPDQRKTRETLYQAKLNTL